MTQLLVLAPMRIERLALGGQPGSSVIQTGMGPDRARIAAARALAHEAPALAVAGLCAGVDPTLRAGDALCATELVDDDGTRTPVPGSSLLVAALRRRGLRVHVGPLASTSAILGPADRAGHAGLRSRSRHGVGMARRGGRRPTARRRSGGRRRGGPLARRSPDGDRRPTRLAQPSPGERSPLGVGCCGRPEDASPRRAAVVLRRRRPRDRHRRAGARAAGRADLRPQADRPQRARRRRPRGSRRSLRRGARRRPRRRDRRVLRARRLAGRQVGRGGKGARRDRRDLPARLEGACRGAPVCGRGEDDLPDRPCRPRGGRGDARGGARLDPARRGLRGRSPHRGGRPGARRVPDADHACGRRDRRDRRPSPGAVPGAGRTGFRGHLLRHLEPPGRRSRSGAGGRRRARRGLRGLVETRSGSSRSPAARAPTPTSSTTRPRSTSRGSRGPPPSRSPPAPRRPSGSCTASSPRSRPSARSRSRSAPQTTESLRFRLPRELQV